MTTYLQYDLLIPANISIVRGCPSAPVVPQGKGQFIISDETVTDNMQVDATKNPPVLIPVPDLTNA